MAFGYSVRALARTGPVDGTLDNPAPFRIQNTALANGERRVWTLRVVGGTRIEYTIEYHFNGPPFPEDANTDPATGDKVVVGVIDYNDTIGPIIVDLARPQGGAALEFEIGIRCNHGPGCVLDRLTFRRR